MDIIQFCELNACRRKFLLNYFGENREKECGNCDVCARDRKTFDATTLVQKILSAVIRTGNIFGKNHVLDVLKGSKSRKILQRRHNELSVYGIAREVSRDLLDHVFRACRDRELLQKNPGDYSTFSVSDKGRIFLKDRQSLVLACLAEEELAEKPPAQAYDDRLFERLRLLRKKLADQKKAPPFVIFGDKTLQEIATCFPQTIQQFGRLYGVGQKKLQEFGPLFLPIIQQYCRENNLSSREPPEPRTSNLNQTEKKATNKNRYAKTLDMVARRLPLTEIAKQQNLKNNTIIQHMARLIEAGEPIDIAYLKPEPLLYKQISRAFAACGPGRLKPVYDYLEGKVDYSTIRLVELLEKPAAKI